MALTRRRRKFLPTCGRKYFALAVVVIVLSAAMGPLGAATTERVVTDWHTGLAIAGFDPVAYFTNQRPLAGEAGFELQFEGVVWRFRNEGNRAAFADHPEVYRPGYGGYDPVAASRGVAVAGNPLLWVIAGERLYLFHDPEAQAAFTADPDGITGAATARWPRIVHALAP